MVTVLEGHRVVFRFLAPAAWRVQVVGEFTQWLARPIEMAPDRGGWWRVSTRLSPGEYRFRYLVNGQWVTDYAAFGVARNAFGQFDSILVVGANPAAPSPAALTKSVGRALLPDCRSPLRASRLERRKA